MLTKNINVLNSFDSNELYNSEAKLSEKNSTITNVDNIFIECLLNKIIHNQNFKINSRHLTKSQKQKLSKSLLKGTRGLSQLPKHIKMSRNHSGIPRRVEGTQVQENVMTPVGTSMKRKSSRTCKRPEKNQKLDTNEIFAFEGNEFASNEERDIFITKTTNATTRKEINSNQIKTRNEFNKKVQCRRDSFDEAKIGKKVRENLAFETEVTRRTKIIQEENKQKNQLKQGPRLTTNFAALRKIVISQLRDEDNNSTARRNTDDQLLIRSNSLDSLRYEYAELNVPVTTTPNWPGRDAERVRMMNTPLNNRTQTNSDISSILHHNTSPFVINNIEQLSRDSNTNNGTTTSTQEDSITEGEDMESEYSITATQPVDTLLLNDEVLSHSKDSQINSLQAQTTNSHPCNTETINVNTSINTSVNRIDAIQMIFNELYDVHNKHHNQKEALYKNFNSKAEALSADRAANIPTDMSQVKDYEEETRNMLKDLETNYEIEITKLKESQNMEITRYTAEMGLSKMTNNKRSNAVRKTIGSNV